MRGSSPKYTAGLLRENTVLYLLELRQTRHVDTYALQEICTCDATRHRTCGNVGDHESAPLSPPQDQPEPLIYRSFTSQHQPSNIYVYCAVHVILRFCSIFRARTSDLCPTLTTRPGSALCLFVRVIRHVTRASKQKSRPAVRARQRTFIVAAKQACLPALVAGS